MKWSKYNRAAEDPEILTFTTNLSPLCLHVLKMSKNIGEQNYLVPDIIISI